MKTATPPSGELPQPAATPLLDPVMLGTLCGLASAAIYTAANICLRAVSDCDPIWVSAVKALPTAILMAPWLLWNSRHGVANFSRPAMIGVIVAGGLCGQLGGNISFQWALGEIGVALTVPLSLGGMIVASAILGRLVLNEPISPRTAVSIVVLLVAIGVLSLGADEARQSVVAASSNPWQLAAGVAVACFAGVAYSLLNVVLRCVIPHSASLPGTLFVVSLVGMGALGSLSLIRLGPAGIAETSRADLAVMLLGGVCNALAFVALTKSLQLTTIVYVNALNATQATMAALAGVLFFQEAASSSLLGGVALTIVGLLFMRQRKRVQP